MVDRIAGESVVMSVIRILGNPSLRRAAGACVASMCYNFFYRQYRAAFFRGRIPVSSVDHPLDGRIPFTPSRVAVYLDFVSFWVRTLGFLLRVYRRRGVGAVKGFLDGMGRLYAFAAEVYAKNLSTTRRPRYYGRPRFLLIHAVDPHLMCVPSLHVMVVIRTYTCFARIVRSLGDGERFAPQIGEIKRGALAITEAILFVKQHSVNCVAASLYAMDRFDGALFPPAEAEDFVSRLFTGSIPPEDGESVRNYILDLYRRFIREGRGGGTWDKPLVDFLQALSRQEGHPPARDGFYPVTDGLRQKKKGPAILRRKETG
ncbi:MAG: hypothetical protein LBP23_01065 [Treponema sp.]|jgi:hypothetical protein|nr:hypothetical protein [Treponema sp.]